MWTRELWGGFAEGKLDMRRMNDGFGGTNFRHAPALFTSRQDARQQYEDVRRIGLTELLSDPRKKRLAKGKE